MHKTIPLLTLLLALATMEARANQITNGSFENTNNTFVGDGNKVDSLASGSSAIPGWMTFNGVPTAWILNGNPWNISASNGSYFLDLTGYSNFGTYGGVTQSFVTVPGTGYVVTFDLGYGGNSSLFRGPVSVRVSAGGTSGVFTSGTGSPNPAVWDTETFGFTATSALTQLSFVGLTTAGGDYIGLDNVDVELGVAPPPPSAVPELGTFGLVATGVGLLGGLVRRRVRGF